MDHKELEVWKESMDLVVDVYQLTTKFPKSEQYGLTSQIQRSAVSVPSNIAEGCARRSEKETFRFLSITLGSLAELETQLMIVERVGYCDSSLASIFEKITKIRQLTLGLMRYIEKRLTTNT